MPELYFTFSSTSRGRWFIDIELQRNARFSELFLWVGSFHLIVSVKRRTDSTESEEV